MELEIKKLNKQLNGMAVIILILMVMVAFLTMPLLKRQDGYTVACIDNEIVSCKVIRFFDKIDLARNK